MHQEPNAGTDCYRDDINLSLILGYESKMATFYIFLNAFTFVLCIQHEIDHLEGKMFIDRMLTDTLMFNYWESVNARSGQFYLGFGGMKPINNFF